MATIDSLASDSFDVVIDLDFDSQAKERGDKLAQITANYYLVGAVLTQLALVNTSLPASRTFGICAVAGLIARPVLEYSTTTNSTLDDTLIKSLNYESGIKVEDRVGMVTPRILAMIINEAYYTFQEGTASKSDIDVGMKLGTAYPKGPFEWADKMGLYFVYSLLLAVYQDTMDERYKICNRLKTEALSTHF
jgi:3-hydroxybutyryl-CoA dehydrogenase